MNVLERYIGKTILSAIMLTLFVLVGLGAIIKFVEEFRQVGRGTYDGLHAAYYTFLMIPRDIETFFPIAALLGSLVGLGGLASRSELVVMQASGFSRFKIGVAVMKTALPLVLITMVMGEWGVPQTEQFARNMRSIAQTGGSMLATTNGFWAKDGNKFVYIQRIKTDKDLSNILIYEFQERELKSVLKSPKAVYVDNHWHLQNIEKAEITPTGVIREKKATQEWKTSITPSKLGVVSLKAESLSLSELQDYVAFLKQTGQDSKRFEITFWRKLFAPLSTAVMMLLAMSFIFGPLRSSTTGAKIVFGIIAGFAFYVANIVFGNLSLVALWLPISVGALIPSMLCLSVVWWLLVKKRE
ncbi:LPS export ABC transporter permease LptG [Phocoenobacter skyensis]|uniref:LPS export ABC transporter permease LptG n=1 Tax=Phocoenobacter skyensis TaxID=97481 RepID=A0A1H7TY57_9PAST|nr:LPS export ABC transporter permease LptG [Pasteurella skyensis]MDP8078633.1 LPS export ABC transporter permease LptG [Pasteurella skyensis]MDP8084627.1 LPS export ABC transporter permease LptG [Pasteurella skyensis]MDP8170791.1 LPS export ABC transporter permease LptG [Pasteurella skyensis]MDP8174891.1 LPS export ABC transporter permease LptG [Pasteurella skyensis]MDP8184227.1 LPS export ABC transporter permease LptG [Pasteurella skyensis]